MKSYTQPSGEIKDTWVKLGDVAADIVSLDEAIAAEAGEPVSAKELIDETSELMRSHTLSEWDAAFMRDLVARRCTHGFRLQLSVKQWVQLRRIAGLVGAEVAS
jgi:hypothetical protein